MLGFLRETWPTAARLLPCRAAQRTSLWTAKCYICSILVLKSQKQREKAEQMAACMRGSQYQGRAALQTSATDLMDEVSHTHLQYEHSHLHQTHMGQHNEPHSYNNVFLVFLVTPFGWSAVFYYSTLTSVFNVHSCLFIRSTLNRPVESSTCFSKKPSKSSAITKAIASVKSPSHR